MSFRARLTSFFVLIVVVPLIGVGLLVFNLINQSQTGKADARADGLVSAAGSIYRSAGSNAKADATAIARNVSALSGATLSARVGRLASQAGLARVTVSVGGRTVLDHGSPSALAPGSATISGTAGGSVTITASELTAAQYTRQLTAPGAGAVVRQGTKTLGSTFATAGRASYPQSGSVSVGGSDYRAMTQLFPGFGSAPVSVTVLSSLSATAGSTGTSRTLAAAFIAAFLVLAIAFAILASRALQAQLARFLEAAQRIGRGDFETRVPTQGHDEFAALGNEFNQMADELSRRIDEVADERARLRESIRRIGQTFASNLDRPALLQLALQTAVDAVRAESGRISARVNPEAALTQASHVGSLAGMEDLVLAAERAAMSEDSGVGEADANELNVVSAALGAFDETDRSHGLITVARRGTRFSSDERDVLRSLASEATLALENVELHNQVRQQAVTDLLTGLTNHGRFQELLSLEVEEGRRYGYPVGLIMLDIDNFKSFNDAYGHPQGDVVLKQVARVLRGNSREVDLAARYGGEEMALILPHTDLEGSHAIAERVRAAVEELRVARLDGDEPLRVTVSVGVSVTSDWDKDMLIADADAALYRAKREGKNRTIKAESEPADAIAAE